MNDPLSTPAPAAGLEPVTGPSGEPVKTDVKLSVTSWLGAESDSKEAEYILSQLDSDNIIDALSQLKDIERRIGPAKFGESRSTRLYNYLKVLSNFKASKKELEHLER